MNDTVPPSRAAILLVQLGTPDKPEVPEVRRYLREFLSDRRVVEQSPLIWWPILYSMVLTRRPKESAEKYRSSGPRPVRRCWSTRSWWPRRCRTS